MIFVMNIEGTVTRVINEPLYQGSNDVNKITLLAPFTSGAVVSCRFKLPNGMYVYPYILSSNSPPEALNPYTMTRIEDFPGFFDESGKRYNMWSLKVDYPLTQFSGELTIQFDISSGSGNQTSSITRVDIGAGLEYVPPPYVANDDPNLATIMSAVGAAEAATAQAGEFAAQAEIAAGAADIASGYALDEAHIAERYATGEQDDVPVTSGIGFENNAKYYAEQASATLGDVNTAGAGYVSQCQSIADSLNGVLTDFNNNVGDLEEVLSNIIALQDYYTGATFNELHAYAEAIEQGGVE